MAWSPGATSNTRVYTPEVLAYFANSRWPLTTGEFKKGWGEELGEGGLGSHALSGGKNAWQCHLYWREPKGSLRRNRPDPERVR